MEESVRIQLDLDPAGIARLFRTRARGSIFVETPRAVPPGGIVSLVVIGADRKPAVRIEGKVAWARAQEVSSEKFPAGLGLKIRSISSGSAEMLDLICAGLAGADGAPPLVAPPPRAASPVRSSAPARVAVEVEEEPEPPPTSSEVSDLPAPLAVSDLPALLESPDLPAPYLPPEQEEPLWAVAPQDPPAPGSSAIGELPEDLPVEQESPAGEELAMGAALEDPPGDQEIPIGEIPADLAAEAAPPEASAEEAPAEEAVPEEAPLPEPPAEEPSLAAPETFEGADSGSSPPTLDCPACGSPVPLGGHVMMVRCRQCNARINAADL